LSENNGLPDQSIRRITIDKEGSIWLGSYYAGLIRLRRGVFTTYAAREGLPFDVLYAVLQARDSSYWLGGFGGLQHIIPERGKPARIENFSAQTNANQKEGRVNAAHRNLHNDFVRCLFESPDGAIWVATFGGLHRIYKGKITVWTTKEGLPDNQIRSVYVARDGAVWIGMTRGLSRFINGKFTTFAESQGLRQANCVCIYEARDGTIWVSTTGSGVYALPQGRLDATFKHFGMEQGLSAPIAFTFHEDRRTGDIWVAANGGLNRIRGNNLVAITKLHGLPDDDVFGIAEDTQGRWWMTCNKGVFCVARQELYDVADGKEPRLISKVHNRVDGMATSNCTVPSLISTLADGRIYFPTHKGVTILDPKRAIRNTTPPPVLIETVVAGSFVVTASPEQATQETVIIPAGHNAAEVHYTALSFMAPERVLFQYKLDGVDKDWIQAGTRRVAYYTNLRPGRYTFHVKACNNDGIWNEREASIIVEIQPFFYQTAWFYTLCTILILAVLTGGYRYRTWRLYARAQELKRLVAERTAALEESNHEIQRQMMMLDEQSREIELVNSQLQENNMRLEATNHELLDANTAVLRQQKIMEEQAVAIELSNAQLQEHNVRLEQLNQEKNEFLGIASHDLKNPLSAIQMTASMLYDYFDRWTAETMKERLQSIVTSARRMSAIISNLLDVNAIESGKLNLELTMLNIAALARSVSDDYAERAAAKSITLNFQTDAHAATAFADERATVEVLDNLVSNAVKYSPHEKRVFIEVLSDGAAVLACYARSHVPPRIGCVLVLVRDEGPGLSEEDKTQLFEKFARLSAKPTGGEHSTGLGLSIVKKMVEAMNGRVWCVSKQGQGAEFIIELPAQGEQTPHDARTNAVDGQ
jgi:signal transduction histidine kinase